MLCSGLRPGSRVLEVGCGTGLLTEEIAKRGVKVYSLDISHELLKKAAGKSGNKEIVFFCSSAYELGFADSVFDNIIGMSVLHHLDMDSALAEFYRVLKKGGKMAFSEPNMLNPHIFCERHFFRERFHNSPDETAFVRFALEEADEGGAASRTLSSTRSTSSTRRYRTLLLERPTLSCASSKRYRLFRRLPEASS